MTGPDDVKPDVRGWDRFPSPGSLIGMNRGCICPPQVNDMGHGNEELSHLHMGRRWVYHRNCTYHCVMEMRHTGVIDEPDWIVLVEQE